jgi:hypothetical protein
MGDMGVSGSRHMTTTEVEGDKDKQEQKQDQEQNTLKPKCEDDSYTKLWTNFDECDPDDIAIHLWTFSMAGTRSKAEVGEAGGEQQWGAINLNVPSHAQQALYKRLNIAILEDDPNSLNRMAFIICGILRWIRRRTFTPTSDIILYRGS